ncbi:hypothetical protein [Rhodococcus aetherivorans]|uniref:hypothetical protein n=1 Tax=Rhodococcus aetherivorans TaxID=191292 RepID=UPI0036593F05
MRRSQPAWSWEPSARSQHAGAAIPALGLGSLLVVTAAVSLLSAVALMLYGFSHGVAVGDIGR